MQPKGAAGGSEENAEEPVHTQRLKRQAVTGFKGVTRRPLRSYSRLAQPDYAADGS
ncbi:hypothetical protein [Verrucomicrobium sp. BvORR034]|uniref:hypothetical protein n=1 Tax=Verrucomicrobium sp. BvORR034 TaxID=1396418 RepID=UPI000AE066F3|nr:hypothetical protein [Verrucomicrobium sp. BvORR034]